MFIKGEKWAHTAKECWDWIAIQRAAHGFCIPPHETEWASGKWNILTANIWITCKHKFFYYTLRVGFCSRSTRRGLLILLLFRFIQLAALFCSVRFLCTFFLFHLCAAMYFYYYLFSLQLHKWFISYECDALKWCSWKRASAIARPMFSFHKYTTHTHSLTFCGSTRELYAFQFQDSQVTTRKTHTEHNTDKE